MNKSIAIVTFANLPLPAVKGGAVETLLDNICDVNEVEGELKIDIYSIYDENAEKEAQHYQNTKYIYYNNALCHKVSFKNILYHFTGISIPTAVMHNIVKKINKNCYDLVLITSIFKELFFLVKMINTKVVWYLHADAVPILGESMCRKIANLCFAIISVSDFVSNQIKKTGSETKCFTVLNCTDLKRISEDIAYDHKQKMRLKHGISNNEKVFLYVGRINPLKGVKELVQAFNKLDNTHIWLLIAGTTATGNEKTYMEEIKRLSNNRVRFLGYIDHKLLNEIYNECDVLVVPSICNEAAGLVVLEAQRCGKYVIASRRGGIPEYAKDEMTTFVETDEHFIINLQKAMQSWLNQPQTDYFGETIRTPVDLYHDFCKVIKYI